MNKLFFRFVASLMFFVFSFQTIVSAGILFETNNLSPKSQLAQNQEELTPVPISPVKTLLNRIKPWVVVFFFVMATQAFGQNSVKTINPLFQAVKGTVSEQRVELEKTFADQLYTAARDHNRNIIYLEPGNKNYIGQPDFENYVSQNSAPTTEAVKEMLNTFNYLVYNTIYQRMTLADGRQSSFYHEVKRVAKVYGVDPYLLMMHAVLERLDRTSIEQYTDKLSDKASKGHFQMQGVSLLDHVRRIYVSMEKMTEKEKEKVIESYPFIKRCPSYQDFISQVDLNKVLDFTNVTSYDPLEIELAATFLKVQMTIVDRHFPSLYPQGQNFVGQALSAKPTLQEKNLLTAWTLFYTAGSGRYAQFKSLEEIFDNCKEKDPHMYTWSKYSWRLYDYIRSIDKMSGYQGFNEQNFVNIDGTDIFENQSKNPLTLFLYLLKTVPRAYLALGFIGMLGFLYGVYKLSKAFKRSDDSRAHQKRNGTRKPPLIQRYVENQHVADSLKNQKIAPRQKRGGMQADNFDYKHNIGDYADRQRFISRAA